MARTTIAMDLIEAIKLGTARKEEVLRDLDDASEGAETLRVGTPAVTVKFHALREPSSHASIDPQLARGTLAAPQATYELAFTSSLYALDDAARVDVIRLGRRPDQDVVLFDPQVSREHGLVIYAGRLPLFCDYGSLKAGAHSGSTNGTYVDGVTRICDAMITWLPTQALMLGQRTHPPFGERRFPIKITYELHPALHLDVGN
jgi:hypothetical protein